MFFTREKNRPGIRDGSTQEKSRLLSSRFCCSCGSGFSRRSFLCFVLQCSVAVFANFDLLSVNFHFVNDLNVTFFADRTNASSVCRESAKSSSTMVFRHSLLLFSGIGISFHFCFFVRCSFFCSRLFCLRRGLFGLLRGITFIL